MKLLLNNDQEAVIKLYKRLNLNHIHSCLLKLRKMVKRSRKKLLCFITRTNIPLSAPPHKEKQATSLLVQQTAGFTECDENNLNGCQLKKKISRIWMESINQ